MEDGLNIRKIWRELMDKREELDKLKGQLRVIHDEHDLKVAAIRDKLKKT